MKVNRATDMALRIAMMTATLQSRATVDELAMALVLPRSHVAKVVQRLSRLGVLVTIRGRSGGVVIAEGAGEMTVGEIVRAFEGDDEVVECHRPPCPLLSSCQLRVELRRAHEAFIDVLDGVRISDLITGAPGALLRTLAATPAMGPVLVGQPTVGPPGPVGRPGLPQAADLPVVG
ncbi:RrF2 family transcriptional regulator [Micromonospora sp. WMMA1923]|uniref:Transcriptional regulator, BadM/Rrf2 family n=1 Tax=Micromonospora yangpuensis TaxID=683228 RepID=A0A1C6UG36_9ACTN|nr:Rrf2 family transcriptional regulator [Micromonospora yangpuensis]SCL52934.1 transcriptional regulator, BadM/Rrf2 family [Micromonospora yangpuensis]